MKVLFILPAIGKKKDEKYIGTWKMEPLTIAVLAALLPSGVEPSFYDDRLELIDYDAPADLVMITVETYTARRSYQIAGEFKKRGKTVVMGGYHATLIPQEVSAYADSVIVGSGESVMTELIRDFQSHSLKKQYAGGFSYSPVLPDKSIFKGKKYLPVSLVEVGRGCNNHCDFCAIASYYNCRYYKRPMDHIVRDIKQSEHKYHFLVDDNLVADRRHAMELFAQVSDLKIKWAGQGTLSMARDRELLSSMKKSGCEIILIGFESLEEENLQQMNKTVNLVAGQRDELVARIHEAGMGIYATFVLGYDHDTEATIEKTLRFSEKHKFYTAAFNHLLPFPGTPLYKRMEEEHRLLYDKWWLQENYHYGEVAFRPKNMTPERLSQVCRDARSRFSDFPNTVARGFQAMRRSSPLLWGLFWGMNLRIGGEVDQKMNIPIGGNLDELPK